MTAETTARCVVEDAEDAVGVEATAPAYHAMTSRMTAEMTARPVCSMTGAKSVDAVVCARGEGESAEDEAVRAAPRLATATDPLTVLSARSDRHEADEEGTAEAVAAMRLALRRHKRPLPTATATATHPARAATIADRRLQSNQEQLLTSFPSART